MQVKIRPSRHDDIDAITSFTTGTFEWGDYVPESIRDWMDDASGAVFVAVDDGDKPIALGRCFLLTSTEAWVHAARVHPDHRGQGIAGKMATVLTDWAREQGAHVARLMVEENNASSVRHIQKTAFRKTATVHRCFRSLGAGAPHPQSNGGSRRHSNLVARPIKATDAEMFTAMWPSTEPGRTMRGLIAQDWSFHRLNTQDTIDAATQGRLWEIGGSWAITFEHAGEFVVELVAASADDAADVARSLIDLATSHGATTFSAWVADLPWLVSAFEHMACDTEPSGIWAVGL